jgi:hypothetical protein
MSSVTGKFLSARTSSILVPTNPVAPTTATFIFSYVYIFYLLFVLSGAYGKGVQKYENMSTLPIP